MKAVKAELEKNHPERVEAFEKNASSFAKKIVTNFKDYEFYIGESMNPDGMVALLNYREDGTTPCEYAWILSLKARLTLQTSPCGRTALRALRSKSLTARLPLGSCFRSYLPLVIMH